MAWNEEKAMEAALSLKRGEQKGFEFFFNALYKTLRFRSFVILKDEFWADDIVEGSFIKLWQERQTIDAHPKVITSWLYTTVKNDSLNKKTTNSIRHKNEKNCSSLIDLITPETDHALIKAEVYRELYDNIDSLPIGCRRILKLLFLEGLSIKEIATKLSLTPSCIKTQKARALTLLRKKYKVSPELIQQKNERWVKAIYFSRSKNNGRSSKLYGMNICSIWNIRNGVAWASITKDFKDG